jgi:hypothetical protein
MQTAAAIIQSFAALVFILSVFLQHRSATIDRLLRRWERSGDSETHDELAGTPYSQRQIEFVNERLKNDHLWWWWPWRGGF